MKRIATLSLCAILGNAGALRAENAFDLIFRSGTLDGLPRGTELRYDATGPTGADGTWRHVVVGLGPGDEARVENQDTEGENAAQPLGTFRASIGNPVAMVFLERTVMTVAEETGGSPFYIRNRMRDALADTGEVESVTVAWDGGSVPATEISLTPFVNDVHRAELGGFANLEIRVVVSEEVPGWYHSISAAAPAVGTGDAYVTSLALAEVGP